MSHEAQPAHPTDAARLHARRREPAIPQATPPPARAPMSVTKVQQWVSSVLAATVIGHLSVGMVFAALYAPKQSCANRAPDHRWDHRLDREHRLPGHSPMADPQSLAAGRACAGPGRGLCGLLALALPRPTAAVGATLEVRDDKPNVEDMQPSRSGASRGPDQGGQPLAANVATSGTLPSQAPKVRRVSRRFGNSLAARFWRCIRGDLRPLADD